MKLHFRPNFAELQRVAEEVYDHLQEPVSVSVYVLVNI